MKSKHGTNFRKEVPSAEGDYIKMKCLFKLSWECLDVKALGKMGLKHEQCKSIVLLSKTERT